MSFGLEDSDWVDPDEEEVRHCGECDEFVPCPGNCGFGICCLEQEFMNELDECYL